MKRGVRISNGGRGGIVDETALAESIESGHVAGAALDVFEKEPPGDSRLVKLPQVLTTPHLGASTDEAQELVALEAADIISGFLLRNEVRHAVNMAPLSAAEMADMKAYLDLGRRPGLPLAPQNKARGGRAAHTWYAGQVGRPNTP